MKKIIRKGLLLMLGLSITMGTVIGAAIVPATPVSIPAPASTSTDPTVTFRNALAEFKSLSKKERKARVKEVKKQLKEYKKQKRNGNEPSDNQVLLIILAILLPPLAVYLHEGVINNKFWISLVLTLLFWLPGVIYALVVVLDKDN
jgi:uncharacterized membrane protein YqaE (UPF0057 family)